MTDHRSLELRYQGTRIADTPTFNGIAGQAWRVALPPIGQRSSPDADGTVGLFIVRAPGAHILWDHWLVCVIHLREIAGVKPAVKQFDAASHELMIAALDPTEPLPALTVDAGWRPRWLRPIDVLEQFAAADDVTANEILELAVRAIVDGHLSPDQDFRSVWKRAIAETSAHFATGAHWVERH